MTETRAKHIWSHRWADPKHIFDGLTGDYDLYRPHYADAALTRIRDYAGGVDDLLDLGSGTGILTRALRPLFPNAHIWGAEPGYDMLAEAVQASPAKLNLDWLAVRAEALPFAGGSLDLITVGQAAHWFDRPTFYNECRRVLRRSGVLALLYNNRVKDSPIAIALDLALHELAPGYHRDYRDFDAEGELKSHPATRDVQRLVEPWVWERTADQFIGYIRSTSHFKVAVQERPESEVLTVLDAALSPHVTKDGVLHVPYETVVTLARFG